MSLYKRYNNLILKMFSVVVMLKCFVDHTFTWNAKAIFSECLISVTVESIMHIIVTISRLDPTQDYMIGVSIVQYYERKRHKYYY